MATLLGKNSAPTSDDKPHHSNAIIVVDKVENIAAITHSINTVIWGDTCIEVDGIPIPDAARFQQSTPAGMKPEGRVPHGIIDSITFKDDMPVQATGGVGSALGPESIWLLLGVLGQHQYLATVMAAPVPGNNSIRLKKARLTRIRLNLKTAVEHDRDSPKPEPESCGESEGSSLFSVE